MEERNKKFLIYAVTMLRKVVSKIDELLNQDDVSPASKYASLTPAKIEGPNEYFTAMDYALSKKDIKNIAVTGAYGAGKSTVISSYMDKFRKGQHISVSLAGFDMEKKDAQPKPQEVELSILQQILYKENGDALPDSKIDRILNRNRAHIKRTFLSTLKLTIPLGFLLALIFPEKALGILGLPDNIMSWLSLAAPFKSVFLLLSFGLSLYCFSEFTSRIGIFDKKIKLNKISLLSGEVETVSGESSSLLNNCLDEMVYFFSKIESYRIVVFEDLDRLKNHDIFVKLREINTIINNNLSDDNPLRFIYAVRDDVFPGTESRTKFFDFIIPIVPVMDVSNAYSLLNDRMGESVAGSQDCLRGTSMYINDMRCLQNIVNEYLIFEKLVDNNNRKINLYSLIFYKNTFSHDYGLIDKKISVLYRFVHDYRRLNLHDEYFSSLEENISILSDKLNSIIKEHSSTTQDIRESILSSLIPKNLSGVVVFQHSNNNYHFYAYDNNELISNEDYFIEFLVSKNTTRISSVINTNDSRGSYNLSESERIALLSDYQRRKILIGDDRSQTLEKTKSDLAEAKEKLRRKKAISLSELVSLMTLAQFSARAESYLDDLKTHHFLTDKKRDIIRDEMRYGGTSALYLLLSRGFLDQDFMRSRSIFHKGGLSLEDNEFIKNVPLNLSFEESNDKYVIDDVEGVLNEITAQHFLHFEAVLHHQVIDYLLRKSDTRLDEMIATLFNKTGNTILSILSALENRFKEPDSFVLLLVSILDRNSYLDALITHLQVADKSDENSRLSAAVVSYAHAEWAGNRKEFRKYVERLGTGIVHAIELPQLPSFLTLIRTLAVRYEKLTPAISEEERELHRFAGEHHLYRLTSENVGHVLSARLSSHGYTVSECQELPWSLASSHDTETYQYFLQDPETFVREVFLTSQEDAAAVNTILRLTLLSDDLKLRIVREMSFCLDSLTDMPREPSSAEDGKILSFRDLLYRYNRVYALWPELLDDLDDGGDWQVLTDFMARHASILGEDRLEGYDEKTYINIYKYVICNYDFDESSYKKILRNIEIKTDMFDQNIGKPVITRLIKNSKIELNENNYSNVISRIGTGDDILETLTFWFQCYQEEFMINSSFYLQAAEDNNAFESLLKRITDSHAFPDLLKKTLVIQQTEYYLSLPEDELPISEALKLDVFYLSQDEKFKMKIMRSLILSQYRNKTVLAQMAKKMQESELKKIFTQKTSATISLNDRDSCIPLFDDLRQAGMIKAYDLRDEGKVFLILGDSSNSESE
ncbi:hypothetical protein H8R20_06615 [Morganella morganii]|uniref:YobI family P-loop NTPase n=1 Tax=Morganella morganii TaxID=582 RepID=UPI001646B4BE|nr:hypothetical protein [Morganella morganii]MBC3995272.1 hypothetical protein [Morganella morganii]